MHFVSPGSWNLPANDVLLYGAGGVVYTAMLSAFAVTSPPCPSCKRDPPGPWALHSILIVTWEPGIANSELHTSHQLMELFEHVELEEVDRSRHVPYLVGGGGGGGDVGGDSLQTAPSSPARYPLSAATSVSVTVVKGFAWDGSLAICSSVVLLASGPNPHANTVAGSALTLFAASRAV